MKRLTAFLSIFLIMGLGIITVFSIKPKAAPPLQQQESLKFIFKDYVIDNDNNNYIFNFSFIDLHYDFFIFVFSAPYGRTLSYGLEYDDMIGIKNGSAIMLTDRFDLNWKIYFSHTLGDDDYVLAFNYNFLININDNLTNAYSDIYEVGKSQGHYEGYNEAYDEYYYSRFAEGALSGFDNGFDNALDRVFNDGFRGTAYDDENSFPYLEGFYQGIDDAHLYDFSFSGLLSQIFVGIGSFLSIELLPNISFGAIIAVPIVFGIIAFIIGKRGGKDD